MKATKILISPTAKASQRTKNRIRENGPVFSVESENVHYAATMRTAGPKWLLRARVSFNGIVWMGWLPRNEFHVELIDSAVDKFVIDNALTICYYIRTMNDYKTYNARNAVKAAQVTNHIKAGKKLGQTHGEAKAEAYRLYNIKAALPILREAFEGAIADRKATQRYIKAYNASGLATTPPKELL
jgi:hypothetical protein